MMLLMIIIFGVLWSGIGFFIDVNNIFDYILQEKLGISNKNFLMGGKWILYLCYTYSFFIVTWKIVAICGGMSFVIGVLTEHLILEAPDQAINYILTELPEQTLVSAVEKYPDAIRDQIIDADPNKVIDEVLFRFVDKVIDRLEESVAINDSSNSGSDID